MSSNDACPTENTSSTDLFVLYDRSSDRRSSASTKNDDTEEGKETQLEIIQPVTLGFLLLSRQQIRNDRARVIRDRDRSARSFVTEGSSSGGQGSRHRTRRRIDEERDEREREGSGDDARWGENTQELSLKSRNVEEWGKERTPRRMGTKLVGWSGCRPPPCI